MKKLNLIVWALFALCFVACSEEEVLVENDVKAAAKIQSIANGEGLQNVNQDVLLDKSAFAYDLYLDIYHPYVSKDCAWSHYGFATKSLLANGDIELSVAEFGEVSKFSLKLIVPPIEFEEIDFKPGTYCKKPYKSPKTTRLGSAIIDIINMPDAGGIGGNYSVVEMYELPVSSIMQGGNAGNKKVEFVLQQEDVNFPRVITIATTLLI